MKHSFFPFSFLHISSHQRLGSDSKALRKTQKADVRREYDLFVLKPLSMKMIIDVVDTMGFQEMVIHDRKLRCTMRYCEKK